MNRFHRWFCRTDLWQRMLNEKVIPWALKGTEMGGEILEIGPGPGLTTNILRQRFPRMTCIEIDQRLASSISRRMQNTNVTVVEGSATDMPFPDNSFSGVVSFTMLHHVPSPQLQDQLIAEAFRVLRPGGTFAGTDSTLSPSFRLMHLWDTMVIVPPETFGARLEAAGFTDVFVDRVKKAFRFRARRPPAA